VAYTERECLKSIEWLSDLAFLVDIRPTCQLNDLNLKCTEATYCLQICATMLLLSK